MYNSIKQASNYLLVIIPIYFIDFIKYSNNNYSKINYQIDRFFEKIKKCYDFIIYFLNKGKI